MWRAWRGVRVGQMVFREVLSLANFDELTQKPKRVDEQPVAEYSCYVIA
jgi:hypothetical protein